MPRKPKISKDAVLHAALKLIDSEGLPALSMRKLGRALNVEAMSLYRYVPSKEAVLDGVHQTVLEEIEPPPLSGNWIEDVKALSLAFRSALSKHPKALPLFATRSAIHKDSPNCIEKGMDLLRHSFPLDEQRKYAFKALFTFVVGHTVFQYQNEKQEEERDILMAESSPTTSDKEFLFGLETLLLGLQQRSDRLQ